MATPPSSPSAGGFPIAIGALGGTIVGLIVRQPTIGFLAGLALGCAIAVAIWLRGR
jgi:predicted benzoate:H+ symporter BenE